MIPATAMWPGFFLSLSPMQLSFRTSLLFTFIFLGFKALPTVGQDKQAIDDLVKRIMRSQAMHFQTRFIPQEKGHDVFELESQGNTILLRGSNGLSIASALNYYLKNYAHCDISWNGTNMDLPNPLPKVPTKVHKRTPYQYRYYLNYCTFNYSMSWWDWKRWQKEIDWMAMHGINMPLAITGEEYTWYEVYKQMGFTDKELEGFFCGPAYFSWFWMGNLDGWGGPLPLSWMKSHKTLQQQIIKQERALGMTPVLPAFTGHVPAAFKEKYPQAKLKATNWNNGFADTYILDSEDPLFAKIGKHFLETQTKLFGTDHLYSADTFNENEPPSDDPEFLSKLSARIYEGMRQADTSAVWVMQGWLFYSDRKFWKAPQIEALLKAVPDNKMILLDLAAEIEPVWKRTDAFYGKPWIWNQLNNFGGNVNLFGRLEGVAAGPALALQDPNSKNLKGIGLTMEAIENNPVIYELTMQHTWQTDPIQLDEWLRKYARNRYGVDNDTLVQAWQVLRKTAYNGQTIRDGAESIITGRPTFDSTTIWTRTKLNYAPLDLVPAWDLFIKASKKGVRTDGFTYDLVDVTRQVMANYATPLQQQFVSAYKARNMAGFHKYSKAYLELIDDMDRLLATKKDFLLGPWIASARNWGTTPAEKALYEQNARDLITLWGDAESPLHEYANRQWSGLLKDFYKARWEQFFDYLMTEERPDFKVFDKKISQWEWQFVKTQKTYPLTTNGDPVVVAQQMYTKYHDLIVAAYER